MCHSAANSAHCAFTVQCAHTIISTECPFSMFITSSILFKYGCFSLTLTMIIMDHCAAFTFHSFILRTSLDLSFRKLYLKLGKCTIMSQPIDLSWLDEYQTWATVRFYLINEVIRKFCSFILVHYEFVSISEEYKIE